MKNLYLTLGAVLISGVTLPLIADEPTPIQQVASVEGLTEYQLANGLRVLLFPDPSKPVVTVNNTIFVGSRHEGYGEAGMAHLLEHMLFKGTPDHPNVPKVLQERGADFNGTTWLDRTNYYETLPATDDNLEFAIRLEADRMMNSFVRGEDLKSEMTVVRNEFESGENSPSRILGQRMMAAAYEWHNYGKSTIGNRADIERVPVEYLKEFYKKYYQPDNAMLIIAGKFDPEKALELVQKYFGPIPKPERKLPNTYTEEPAQDGERFVTLRRVGEVPLVGLMYHIPSGAHPDYVALDVLTEILTSSPSGRLYKALVESKKASSVTGAAWSLHDPGVLRISITCNKGNAPEAALDVALEEIDKVIKDGVTETEVQRAVQQYLKQFEDVLADSSSLATQMSEWASQGDWRLFFLYRDRVEKVTPEAVREVAAKYLVRNNRTVGFFIPTEKAERISVPPTPDLAEMIGDYKGRETVAQGEEFDVTPASIEKRTTRGKLPSGIQTALLPKKTRGNIVNLRLNLRFGDEKNLQGLGKATEYLGPLMMRGTKNLDRQQIKDELDKNKAQLNASSNPGLLNFTLQTRKENLPAALEILRQVLREPTLPSSELELLKQSSRTSLQQRLNDPQSLAFNAVNRKLNPYQAGDPRYIPTTQEEIASLETVTPENLKKLYDNYIGATAGELVIVGDFNPEEILPLVTEMLADWKAEMPYARLERTAVPKEKLGGSEVILTPDKENATYFAGTVFPMQEDNSDYPALLMADFIFGGGSLSSRLGDRVRQQEGLSYGVGSNVRANPQDARATLSLYAISNPTNVSRVKVVIREELDKLLAEGVTADELEKAKEGYLQNEQVERARDASLAQTLAMTLLTGRTMEFYARREQAIRDLTPDVVNKAMKKWLDPETLFVVIAGDLQKKQ